MAEYEDKLQKLHDEDEKQLARERIIRLETSLTDFITHTDKTILELKQSTLENQKLLIAINNRLDVLEDKFETHVQDQTQNNRRRQWTFSILVPAIVASLIELVNVMIAYGKI
jgi:anti-sigma-K factor RskA